MAPTLANDRIAKRAEQLWRKRENERRAHARRIREEQRAHERAMFLEQLQEGIHVSGMRGRAA